MPNSSMPNFSSFSGGKTFSVVDTSSPELKRLAQAFPRAFAQGLAKVGGYIRKRMVKAIENAGPSATPWQDLSHMRMSRRVTDELKSGNYKKLNRKEKIAALSVWKKGGEVKEATPFGKIGTTIRFKMFGNTQVSIGALNPSAAMFIEAVQGGRRGGKGKFQFSNTQYITPKMRRALWALGMPPNKQTLYLKQPERPLVLPVYNAVQPFIVSIIEDKIASHIENFGESFGF